MSKGPESVPSDRLYVTQWIEGDLPVRSAGVDGVILVAEASAPLDAGGPDMPEWKSELGEAIAKLADAVPRGDCRPRRVFLAYDVLRPSEMQAVQSVQRAVGTFLAASPSSDDATEVDVDEWGPVIPDEKVATLEQANLKLQVEHRRQELSASMSRTQAADLLGVSPQTVSEWVAQHKLVGIKDGREWRFPAWQFTPDNAEPALPDLDRLVATFPGGEVSLSRWMNRPNDNFAGRTPAQEMARDSDHVIAIVETLTAN